MAEDIRALSTNSAQLRDFTTRVEQGRASLGDVLAPNGQLEPDKSVRDNFLQQFVQQNQRDFQDYQRKQLDFDRDHVGTQPIPVPQFELTGPRTPKEVLKIVAQPEPVYSDVKTFNNTPDNGTEHIRIAGATGDRHTTERHRLQAKSKVSRI